MAVLRVQLKIPIESEPLISTPAMIFSHWLPIGKTNGISLVEDGVELLFWFDIKSTWWASQPKEENLRNHVNVLAHYILADVTVRKVSNELAGYMRDRDFSKAPNSAEAHLQKEYELLGCQVLTVVIKRFNKLIAFGRAYKGQYWLQEYVTGGDQLYRYFSQFKAKATINKGKEFRFQPAAFQRISAELTPQHHYIKKDEWNDITEFVAGEHRAPLVLEQLARADQLAGNGYDRSALMEAVSALEVSISEFGRAQNSDGKLATVLGPRLGIKELGKQINHMGLSGTIRYLLPTILPESVLSKDVLSQCRKAIEERQNVVHNGKRQVSNVEELISGIQTLCLILRTFSS